MLIDWFTVIAQLVNFLILIWLMKRFLYQPILRAVDEREQLIAAKLAKAESASQDAEQLSELLSEKVDDLDRQQAERMLEMTSEVAAERQRLMEEAKTALEAMMDQRKSVLQRETLEFEQSFRQRISETVVMITGKVLADLSDVVLEDRMVDVFLEQLIGQAAGERARLDARQDLSEAIIVSSSFQLSTARKRMVEAVIHQHLSEQSRIEFLTDRTLICGLVLNWGNFKMSWNIQDYLEALQKNLEHLVEPLETGREDQD